MKICPLHECAHKDDKCPACVEHDCLVTQQVEFEDKIRELQAQLDFLANKLEITLF